MLTIRDCQYRKRAKYFAWFHLIFSSLQTILFTIMCFLLRPGEYRTGSYILRWIVMDCEEGDARSLDVPIPFWIMATLVMDYISGIIHILFGMCLITATDKHKQAPLALRTIRWFYGVAWVIFLLELAAATFLLDVNNNKHIIHIGLIFQAVPIAGLVILSPFKGELEKQVESIPSEEFP